MLNMWIVILTLLLKAASLWFLVVALFALKRPVPYARCAPRDLLNIAKQLFHIHL